MGGGAEILADVVQDEIFEMHELAAEPQRGAGVGELHSPEEASADRRASEPLVETVQRLTLESVCSYVRIGKFHRS
ncbi:hypothetical protein ACVJBD_007647 [Rhizobium mongolense]